MALADYNKCQIEVIKAFIKLHGVDPEVDSPERRKIEAKWVEDGYNEIYRKKWIERESHELKHRNRNRV
jgi:uncharacterized membrane protein YebE (DUF533 family)